MHHLQIGSPRLRKLWAEEIVGAGQQGKRVTLPALFLRETAESLRRSPVPLYLFLGSDFPISDANRFTGLQNAHFERIKETGEPQFFRDEEIGFETAMFSDVAAAEACVSCHNNEPETTKSDWNIACRSGTDISPSSVGFS